MKSSDMFSFKDYFNYYFAGVIWFLDFVLLFLLFSGKWGIDAVFSTLGKYSNDLGAILGGVLSLVIPYIVGFTMSPVGEGIRKLWQGKDRERFPDPRKYLIIHEGGELKNKRIPKKEAKVIKAQIKSKFKFENDNSDNNFSWLFFPMRAYVIEYGGESKNLGIRARTLANLTESLLLPVPFLVCLFGLHILLAWVKQCCCISPSWRCIGSFSQNYIGLILGLLLIFSAAYKVHRILLKRYFQLERYWVRHFYRAFLVMQSDSLEVSKKPN
jgi:hypothetical protein